MDNLQERVKPYLVEKPDEHAQDVRDKFHSVNNGVRLVDGRPMYSAAWLDGDGNFREFAA